MTTSLILGLLALALAGPAPRLVAGWSSLRQTPMAALIWWQCLALAAVLAALGAGLSVVTSQVWRGPVSLLELAVAAVAASLTLMVLVRLLLSGHRVGTSLRRSRARHRELVDVLARRRDGVHVVALDVPVAYCVPGMARSRIVVSEEAISRLAAPELAAVLAHERCHLRWRHDLVLEAFTVLHRAFPRFVASATARAEVELLIEVLADRAAVRELGQRPVLTALLRLAEGGGRLATDGAWGTSSASLAGGAMAAAATGLGQRAHLAGSRRQPVQAVLVLASAVAVLALPTVPVAVPWLCALAGG